MNFFFIYFIIQSSKVPCNSFRGQLRCWWRWQKPNATQMCSGRSVPLSTYRNTRGWRWLWDCGGKSNFRGSCFWAYTELHYGLTWTSETLWWGSCMVREAFPWSWLWNTLFWCGSIGHMRSFFCGTVCFVCMKYEKFLMHSYSLWCTKIVADSNARGISFCFWCDNAL